MPEKYGWTDMYGGIQMVIDREDMLEPGEPECGFLFPAFTGRSSDIHHIAVYNADAENPHTELTTDILKIQTSI